MAQASVDNDTKLTSRSAGRIRLLITLLVSIVFIFVFIVGEVALRVVSNVSDYAPKIYMPFYEKHYYLGKTLVPHIEYSNTLASLSINSRGFRGDEFAVPKPDNVYRIFALGGSTTFGFFPAISNNDHTYPAQLQKQLNTTLDTEKTIEVINAGVPGYSVRTSLINLAARVLYYQPDMILVYHNTNDLSRYGHEEELYYPLDKLAERRSGWAVVTEVLFGWSYLLTELQYTFVNRVLPLFQWHEAEADPQAVATWQEDPRYGQAFQRELSSLVAIAKHNNVEVALISQSIAITDSTDFNNLTDEEKAMQLDKPDPYHRGMPVEARSYMFRRYNQIIEQVANQQNTIFVDADNLIPKTAEYHWDYCHFTDKGAATLAATVREGITPVLVDALDAKD